MALNLAVRGAEVQAMLEGLVLRAGLDHRVRISGDPTCIGLEFAGTQGRAMRRRFTAQLAARGVHAPEALCVSHRHGDAEIDALLDATAAALEVVAGGAQERAAQAA